MLEKKRFNSESYEKKYLGNYLKNKFGNDVLPKTFTAPSGTLSNYYKNKLAMVASANMQWDEMSLEAQTLTKKIFNFIKKCNS